MTTFAEERMQQGEAQGRATGRVEGQAEEVLLTLLASKLAPLTAQVEARIQSSAPEQVLTWAQRTLDAAPIDDVFEDCKSNTAVLGHRPEKGDRPFPLRKSFVSLRSSSRAFHSASSHLG